MAIMASGPITSRQIDVETIETVTGFIFLGSKITADGDWGEVRWGEVAQSCLTLCDPVDCNLLGFSVHGILQARILEWIAISFSRGSSWPRDQTRVSRIGGRRFSLCTTREAPMAQLVTAAMKSKDACPLEEKLWQTY